MEEKRGLQTFFPPVLDQYLLQTAEKGRDDQHQQYEEADYKNSSAVIKKSGRMSSEPGNQSSHFHQWHDSPSFASRTSSGVESRNPRWKQQEAERLEHLADLWDQARAQLQEERHQQLHDKLLLQRRLVRAQDYLAAQHRKEEQERHLQCRREAKQRRQTTEAALENVCRQSLDRDRQKAAADRRAREVKGATPGRVADPRAGDSADGVSGRRQGAWKHPGCQPSLPQLASSPPRREHEARPAGGGHSAPERHDGDGKKALPWQRSPALQQHSQLADIVACSRPKEQAGLKLKSIKGHIGAGELWDLLRLESKTRLVHNDQRFPPDLKAAFGAFVRERLTKHCRPVQRSFCASEDVPNIDKLLDQSRLKRTRLLRHKAELMYRSSVNNKDRTTILLYNNPMPDVTDSSQEGISRYLPSWEEHTDEASEAEYSKWLKRSEKTSAGSADDKENTRHSACRCQLRESAQELHNILLSVGQKRHKHTNRPRYHFLTEKVPVSDGSFSKRFQDEQQAASQHQVHADFKSHSAVALSHTVPEFTAPVKEGRGHSAHSQALQKFCTSWQPLSLTALREYKKQLETGGEGDFGHGRLKMWPVVS